MTHLLWWIVCVCVCLWDSKLLIALRFLRTLDSPALWPSEFLKSSELLKPSELQTLDTSELLGVLALDRPVRAWPQPQALQKTHMIGSTSPHPHISHDLPPRPHTTTPTRPSMTTAYAGTCGVCSSPDGFWCWRKPPGKNARRAYRLRCSRTTCMEGYTECTQEELEAPWIQMSLI